LLKELEAAMKDAEENMGDIELRDARLAKADYFCKLGAPLLRPVRAGCTQLCTLSFDWYIVV